VINFVALLVIIRKAIFETPATQATQPLLVRYSIRHGTLQTYHCNRKTSVHSNWVTRVCLVDMCL